MAIYCSEQELKDEIILLQKVEELKELLAKDPNSPRVQELKNQGVDENYKKTNFGKMVLDIVNHLGTKSNFGGYTESWKTDMTSNAIEKVMRYTVKNFNPDLISKISGEPVKAFAYVTQIAHNAFIETIRKLKQEQDTINELISYEDLTNIKIKTLGRERNTNEVCETKYDYLIAIGATDSTNGNYNIMLGRNKNIPIPDDKTYKENTYFVMDYSVTNNIIETGEFVNIYQILKKYKDKSIKFIYPLDYKISIEEYSDISSLEIETLNLTRYDNTYTPSFPSRKKKELEDPLSDWFSV